MVINNQFKDGIVQGSSTVKVVNADKSTFMKKSDVVIEHYMEIYLNEHLILKLVCTPQNLTELVAGRLVSEGYITCIEDVESIYVCENGQRAKVFVNNAISLEDRMKPEPTCCTANKILLRPEENRNRKVLTRADYRPEWIFELAKEFSGESIIHKRTNGTHSCYLMYAGKIIFIAEDIGRHNALDKAVGYILLNGYDREHCILFTSGRVPVDMVEKVIHAGIPILVSKAVPTDDAVQMAKNYNLTLICKAWQDSYEVFHEAEERIVK